MKNRFILFQRSGVFYCEDTSTGRQTSLRTKDKADALRLLHVKNEAAHQPAMNLQIPPTRAPSIAPIFQPMFNPLKKTSSMNANKPSFGTGALSKFASKSSFRLPKIVAA